MGTKKTPLVETLGFQANSTTTKKLPQSGFDCQYELLFTLGYDSSTDYSAAEDAFARIVKGVAIKDGEGKTWLSYGDGRQLYYKNFLMRQGNVRMDTPETNVSGQTAKMLLILHPGLKPLTTFDKSCGVPTRGLTDPSIEVTWGSHTDTESAGTLTINSLDVSITPATYLPGQIPSGADTFVYNARHLSSKPGGETYSNLSWEVELPTGNMVKASYIIVLDSAGDRSNTAVSEVGFKRITENMIPYKAAWSDMQDRLQTILGLSSVPNGVGMINWTEEVEHPMLNLTDRMRGEDKLCFTTAETGITILVFQQAYAG